LRTSEHLVGDGIAQYQAYHPEDRFAYRRHNLRLGSPRAYRGGRELDSMSVSFDKAASRSAREECSNQLQSIIRGVEVRYVYAGASPRTWGSASSPSWT
jgi:hypothetical protein